jgi:hypothetical protein
MQARFRNATVSEMAMRKFELMGTAVLLLAAAPAWADNSTAAERAATRELNQQQSQMAAPAFADASATLPDNSPPAAAPTARVESASIKDGAETLSSLTNPPSKIASANVLDASGQTIGAVQRVEVTPQGQPTKVSVALLGKDEKMVVLDAGAVKYDASKNQITSQEAGDQIRSRAS